MATTSAARAKSSQVGSLDPFATAQSDFFSILASTPPSVDLNGTDPGTGNSVAYAEGGAAVQVAPGATMTDPDSPDYEGGTLSVEIVGGGSAEDALRVVDPSAAYTVEESDLYYSTFVDFGNGPVWTPVVIGLITGGNGDEPLAVTFNANATPAIVEGLLRTIAFVSYSGALTAGDRTLRFVLTDGDGGESSPVDATVQVSASDDPAVAQDDQIAAYENAVSTGSLFADNGNGNDIDPDGPGPTVAAVNGQAADVGETITLASGALLTVNADGTFAYDPNGQFDYLIPDGTGAVDPTTATDSFTYTLVNGNTATATVLVQGVTSPGERLNGDAAGNVIDGTAGSDRIDLSQGGDDIARGHGGHDSFWFGGAFSNGDAIDGGAGTDALKLVGNYNLTFDADDLVSVEWLALYTGTITDPFGSPASYRFTTIDANVARGISFVVQAETLTAAEDLWFNGMAETDGSFDVRSGAGDDVIVGGGQRDILQGGAGADQIFGLAGADRITGGAGADVIRGGHGADVYVYGGASDSTGLGFDTLASFEPMLDKIDLPGTVSGYAEITGGQLRNADEATFAADLAAALDSTLQPNSAALFRPDSGDFAGRIFLVVDGDGDGAYQSGVDFVIELASPVGIIGSNGAFFI